MNQRGLTEFWQSCLDAEAVGSDTPMPTDIWSLSDSPEMADELLSLVLTGVKSAIASDMSGYADASTLPVVGDLSIVLDGAGRARALTCTTEVRTGPLSSADEGFAWDAGEGDRSLKYWAGAHRRFFHHRSAETDTPFDPDMLMVFERFELLHPTPNLTDHI